MNHFKMENMTKFYGFLFKKIPASFLRKLFTYGSGTYNERF
jgi:hypothetical protein